MMTVDEAVTARRSEERIAENVVKLLEGVG